MSTEDTEQKSLGDPDLEVGFLGYPVDICKIGKVHVFWIYMQSADIWFSGKITQHFK